MTSALKFVRILGAGALAAAFTVGVACAQNGTNYDILTNSFDAAFIGIGAGGTQTASDGILTHIPGENLKGSHKVGFTGTFGYRNPFFREVLCVYNAGPGGATALRFPALLFIELDGTNGNAPAVFTDPACKAGGPQFPLGASGAVPYGLAPGTTASFGVYSIPSFFGLGPDPFFLPNDGAGHSATLIAAASANLPVASTGFCWGVQFTWNPSALASLDDVDSWEHYLKNSHDGNQYWAMSDDELNIWQSSTVGSTGGGPLSGSLYVLPANMDYGLTMSTVEPTTKAVLAPVGANANGPYYSQTAGVVNEYGAPAQNPNGGFDVGRGSQVLSLKGQSGVANPTSLHGNQDPTAAGKLPTLGFATWDNGSTFNGSVRLPWLSVDTLGLLGGDPATDPGVINAYFGVRIPVVSAGLLQHLTSATFGMFGTKTGFYNWPDPDGFATGAFSNLPITGASNQLPTGHLTVCPVVISIPINITYGTSGRKPGPGGLTFNPKIADISGSRELFLID